MSLILPILVDRQGDHNLITGKVYVSGPMTGLPGFNHEEFFLAKKILEELGCDVCIPPECKPEMLEGHPPSYEDYMRADVKGMLECETIVFLPGWHRSPGARAEMILGAQMNMSMFLLHPQGRILVSMEREPGRPSVTS